MHETNDALRAQLYAFCAAAQSHREATGADPRTVPERRYDLGEGSGPLGMYDRHDVDTVGLVIDQCARWCVRSGIVSIVPHFDSVLARYERTTDEDGIECWVLRAEERPTTAPDPDENLMRERLRPYHSRGAS